MSTNMSVVCENGASRASTRFDNFGGVLKVLIRETAIREGIENPNALAQATGLPYETCRRLWREDATRIDLLTIEVLCNTLQVRPGQLFDYEPELDRPKRKRKAGGRKKTSS
jgi:DNA-binding Xre family transcriptional regulator